MAATASRSVEPLVVGRVIGDVLDMFSPTIEFTVHYGSKQVANGCEIKPSATSNKPRVQLSGSRVISNNLYTLVMTDPDAPSPSEPTMREWLHWIVVDIPQGLDASKGKEIVPYMGPKPPTGIHRYVFALFQQRGPMGRDILPPDARCNFSTRNFAAQSGLGLPVAAVYFNAQKEPAARRR
ncbi:protein MOTHER of FT and TFL1-like [Macadamia integrifolia]|uniref:protein MOTHER of FT and TFL1-like n=1 Tax=Macadamia integrifolia TaxID=60698 RepID=UPI001C52BB1F|nr:protein MOTHER of FT and TFL1-like [Macadamia integrifolia]